MVHAGYKKKYGHPPKESGYFMSTIYQEYFRDYPEPEKSELIRIGKREKGVDEEEEKEERKERKKEKKKKKKSKNVRKFFESLPEIFQKPSQPPPRYERSPSPKPRRHSVLPKREQEKRNISLQKLYRKHKAEHPMRNPIYPTGREEKPSSYVINPTLQKI